MKLVLPGGSGQIGTDLARRFTADGHEVVVLSRSPNPPPDARWRVVQWDGRTLGEWAREIDGADVVVNLAGKSVNCRYTPENRRIIKESRVDSVRVVGEAIRAATNPPPVWLQASTATIYAHRFDTANDEATGILGGDEPNAPDTWQFSIDVAKSWEQATNEASVPECTRKVLLRSAIVMAPDSGGAFDVLLGLVRHGLGGTESDGRQYVSWVHHVDFQNALYFLLDHAELTGPVNIAAPSPLPNAEFLRDLRQAWGKPLGIPAANWMLEIGAVFLKTETELILKSRRTIPTRLTNAGFRFQYSTWPDAARDLCQAWRNQHKH